MLTQNAEMTTDDHFCTLTGHNDQVKFNWCGQLNKMVGGLFDKKQIQCIVKWFGISFNNTFFIY